MRVFITLIAMSILQGNILRLSPEFYDNRIPKSIYTYKETSNKIILKESISYYKNGQMSYKVEYDSNGLNSRKTWWYNNGNKSKLVTFKDGKIDGIWTTWKYDGEKELERFYKNGLMLKERLYNK
jgi:antitoxin component YwqK of YwqJK toxin-antitoxin module